MAKGPSQDTSNLPQGPLPAGVMGPGTAPPLQDNWQPSFQNFLPNNGGPATGLTQAMMAMVPQGGMPPQQPAPAPAQAQGQQGSGMTVPQLAMPGGLDQLAPVYRNQIQRVVDSTNKTPGLEGYLSGRDQLSELLALAASKGMGMGGGGQGGGGNYGTSGPSSGGGRMS